MQQLHTVSSLYGVSTGYPLSLATVPGFEVRSGFDLYRDCDDL